MIGRELLDRTKHFYGPRGHGSSLAAVAIGEGDGEHAPEEASATAELDWMAAFHEAIAALPVDEREVICLTYYHGSTQTEIANLLGVSLRTVQRWYEAAAQTLKDKLGEG